MQSSIREEEEAFNALTDTYILTSVAFSQYIMLQMKVFLSNVLVQIWQELVYIGYVVVECAYVYHPLCGKVHVLVCA